MVCVATTSAAETASRGTFVNLGTRAQPLHLWVEELGHGEPVLMLHGLGANVFTWRHVAPALARTHRVIAVDFKGAGHSDKPFDDAYGLLDQVALVKRLIERKHLSGLTLVGHSYGGGVALALTLDLNRTRPGSIKRLVLIDSVAYRQGMPLFIELLRTSVLADVALHVSVPEMVSFKGLYAAYRDPTKITFEAVRAYASPLYDAGGRHALLKTAEKIFPPNLASIVARYRTIHQPALLIWCAGDPVVPLWVGHRLAHTLPNARLAVLTGCGHVPQEEAPARTVSLIRPFMK